MASTIFYGLNDLAERYGTSTETISAWIRTGELMAVNIARRRGAHKPRWRVSAEAVAAFEAARSAVPVVPTRRPRRKRGGEAVVEFYPT
jgi:hypothetical protein